MDVVGGGSLVAGRRSRPVPEGAAQGHGSLSENCEGCARLARKARLAAVDAECRKQRLSGGPWATPSGTGFRERLHEWSSSLRVASSGVAVVVVALYLALCFRRVTGAVVPLG